MDEIFIHAKATKSTCVWMVGVRRKIIIKIKIKRIFKPFKLLFFHSAQYVNGSDVSDEISLFPKRVKKKKRGKREEEFYLTSSSFSLSLPALSRPFGVFVNKPFFMDSRPFLVGYTKHVLRCKRNWNDDGNHWVLLFKMHSPPCRANIKRNFWRTNFSLFLPMEHPYRRELVLVLYTIHSKKWICVHGTLAQSRPWLALHSHPERNRRKL